MPLIVAKKESVPSYYIRKPVCNPNLKIKAITPSELSITLKPCDPTKYNCNV